MRRQSFVSGKGNKSEIPDIPNIFFSWWICLLWHYFEGICFAFITHIGCQKEKSSVSWYKTMVNLYSTIHIRSWWISICKKSVTSDVIVLFLVETSGLSSFLFFKNRVFCNTNLDVPFYYIDVVASIALAVSNEWLFKKNI